MTTLTEHVARRFAIQGEHNVATGVVEADESGYPELAAAAGIDFDELMEISGQISRATLTGLLAEEGTAFGVPLEAITATIRAAWMDGLLHGITFERESSR